MLRLATVLATVARFALGCAVPPPSVTVDSGVTFAIHRAHGGLVIDRFDTGRSGRLRPASWLRRPGEPTFVLEVADETPVAFWLPAPATVVVRRDGTAVGDVRPEWEDGAIRLTLASRDGPPLRTDVFGREGAAAGPSVLTRAVSTVLDVRGTFRAPVRDPAGAAVGWLRVRIGPYLEAPRLYDGVLLASVPPALAVAAAVALDGEVDWIEDHAVNVYRSDGGGRLEQSVPLSH